MASIYLDKDLENRCETHFNPLELYCKDCIRLICNKCMITEHKGHDIIHQEDFIPYFRQQISSLKLHLTSKSSDCHKIIGLYLNEQNHRVQIFRKERQLWLDISASVQKFIQEHLSKLYQDHVVVLKNLERQRLDAERNFQFMSENIPILQSSLLSLEQVFEDNSSPNYVVMQEIKNSIELYNKINQIQIEFERTKSQRDNFQFLHQQYTNFLNQKNQNSLIILERIKTNLLSILKH